MSDFIYCKSCDSRTHIDEALMYSNFEPEEIKALEFHKIKDFNDGVCVDCMCSLVSEMNEYDKNPNTRTTSFPVDS